MVGSKSNTSQRLVLIVSGIPHAIINFAPGLRRASDETRLTVPRPSPRCPLIFLGWCLGFFFLFAFYDHYRLRTATVWIIEYHHCFHNFLCLPVPPPPPLRPFTNSSLSSFVWNSSSLHPETRHSFHQGVFCHKINRNLGEIDTEAGSSATGMAGATSPWWAQSTATKSGDTMPFFFKISMSRSSGFLHRGSWTRRLMGTNLQLGHPGQFSMRQETELF